MIRAHSYTLCLGIIIPLMITYGIPINQYEGMTQGISSLNSAHMADMAYGCLACVALHTAYIHD